MHEDSYVNKLLNAQQLYLHDHSIHCIIIILCRLAHFVVYCSVPAHWCSGRPPVSSPSDCDRGADVVVYSWLSTLSVKEGVSTQLSLIDINVHDNKTKIVVTLISEVLANVSSCFCMLDLHFILFLLILAVPLDYTVQSSYRLNLSPHLIVHASTIEMKETIGQGLLYNVILQLSLAIVLVQPHPSQLQVYLSQTSQLVHASGVQYNIPL